MVALCYAAGEANSPESFGAWGYVKKPLGKQKAMHLDPEICAGASDVNTGDPFMRALSVLVVVHESYHLRRWGAAADEAKVECMAVRHWKVGAAMLGATPESIAELWPYALVAHYELSNLSDWFGNKPYYQEDCQVPPLRND